MRMIIGGDSRASSEDGHDSSPRDSGGRIGAGSGAGPRFPSGARRAERQRLLKARCRASR